jgi:Fe-S cluster biogenesis protein NfuA
MSDIQIIVQMTPNPNALKFVVNKDVIAEGKVTYNSIEEATTPLTALLFAVNGVKQVHFFENVITITKWPHEDWADLEDQIKHVVENQMPEHDSNIESVVSKRESKSSSKHDKSNLKEVSSEYLALNAVFDSMVRPALQRDGGDIDIVDIEDNVVTVSYQGACHSCPSASIGTLQYIKAIVNEYDPNLDVKLEEEDDNYW